MIYYRTVNGSNRTIRFMDDTSHGNDLVGMILARAGGKVAVDIETTGLDIFASDFKIRLVQIGTSDTAYVFPINQGGRFVNHAGSLARQLLQKADLLTVHTTDYFDLLALDRFGLISLEDSLPKTLNTYILAHLLDPRAQGEGMNAIGHNLEKLCRHYGVDPDALEAKDALKAVFRSEYKSNLENGWRVIDINHPTYVQYAGLDVIHTADLADALIPQIAARGLGEFSKYEHAIARITAKMMRQGMALDVDYTTQLVDRFTIEHDSCVAEAARLGCDNVNSTKQLADALEREFGWKPTAFTKTGKPQVDKAVLGALEDKGNPLAEAVRQAKRAAKWRDSYADAMLRVRDRTDRVHPKIASLKARTARMSISEPPLQQLPSRDAGGSAAWLVRRCLVADPGQLIVAVDYDTLEMRLLAALAGVDTMLQSIRAGEDLHEMTAAMLYGPKFTPTHRKIAKNVGYGKIYGGGAKGVSRLTGAPVAAVRKAIEAYDKAFPEIASYGRQLQTEALTNDLTIRTTNGRILPVDGDRLYAALNYKIQSIARDILAESLIEADKQGLTSHLLLPVHDEIVAQAPISEARDLAMTLSEILAVDDYHGIKLATSASVGGRSWGSLYGAPDDHPYYFPEKHPNTEAA